MYPKMFHKITGQGKIKAIKRQKSLYSKYNEQSYVNPFYKYGRNLKKG